MSPVSRAARRVAAQEESHRVVAAPVEGRREQFAGKHTVCGSAIGAATFGAVSCGVARWLEENRWPVT